MAVFTVPNVKISGLAASVPRTVEDNSVAGVLPEKEREPFIKTVGIRYRRVAPPHITAADLCCAAADELLNKLLWNRNDIKVLVFVTQTPDYIIPNTSSVLQHRLGLPKDCLVFDVNLGCSGYVYGLSIVAGLLQNMPGKKALLLVGDIATDTVSKNDKSTAPLFSDAGSATGLQYQLNAEMHFNLQTDGTGYNDIIIPEGGYRNPVNPATFQEKEYGPGIYRSGLHMKLDGLKIFNFALREVAPNIEALLSALGRGSGEVDYFVFHQANLLMLESVRKKLKIEAGKVPYSLYDYGNTSSATIPLTMVTQLRDNLQNNGPLKLVLSGFGVGLSWGSAYIETGNIICPELIEVE